MHSTILKQALGIANEFRGRCAPNPAVGSLVVSQGKVVGQGRHRGPGSDHAEVEALKEAGELARGATLYVTLEPCNHTGRTPPCTEAIIASGIQEVIYAFPDPNPKVKGGGTERLRQAGIKVIEVHVKDIYEFYDSYAYWCRTSFPRVTAKLAVSEDGKIAGPEGVPLSLTGEELGRFTHAQRKRTDAILTSYRTVKADDPKLNARTAEGTEPKPVYVIDPRLEFPPTAQLRHTAKTITLFYDPQTPRQKVDGLRELGIRCIGVGTDENGLKWDAILKQVGEDGVHDLWVEAGGKMFQALVKGGYVYRAYLYVAPMKLGEHAYAGPAETPEQLFDTARRVHWSKLGQDSVCRVEW